MGEITVFANVSDEGREKENAYSTQVASYVLFRVKSILQESPKRTGTRPKFLNGILEQLSSSPTTTVSILAYESYLDLYSGANGFGHCWPFSPLFWVS